MLRNGRQGFEKLAYNGCSCHNTKADHRKAKHAVKRREARQWQRIEAVAY
jgi:hypothetical protein